MTEAAWFQSMVEEWKKDNTIIYIFWFDETIRQAGSFLKNKITDLPPLVTTRESSASLLKGKTIVFAEHFPLQQKEKELYQKLNLEKVQVWSALDEPIFQLFDGEKIVQDDEAVRNERNRSHRTYHIKQSHQ